MTTKKAAYSGRDDMDAVLESGKILMESGAEIYRVEETMEHMAKTLQIEQFSSYVVNREIVASGINRQGVQEAKVTSVPNTSVHLGKIEAVNSLSREIEQQEGITLQEIASRLQAIRDLPDSPFWAVLLAYFVGAGCFSYSLGSTWTDSLSSAIAGLLMGLAMQLAGKFIRTKVLLTIIGSAVVTIAANLLYLAGFGEHRGLIILGALMLIVPGAAFTSSVREFSQDNYATGLMLLISALLTCLSIAIGVAVTTEFLPFAEQMNSVFSNDVSSVWDMLARTVMAGIGTVAFSLLFHVPKRYYLDVGVLGAVSWLLYLVTNLLFHMETPAIFVPALFVTLCSRFLAIRRKCPITIFLTTSIFPLLPGLSLYRSVYFLMIGEPALAWMYIRSCFISSFTIAIAIIIIQELRVHRKKREHKG